MTLERVGLFVDTQNLYYAAREYFSAHVDYQKLLEHTSTHRSLKQATAYVVEREGDATAFGFVSKLNILGYRVKRRTVRFHGGSVGQSSNGDWDMGIAADMVRASEVLDVLVLASGDGDFVPIVQLLQDRGRRVEVIAFKETSAQDLLDMVDCFTNLSEKSTFLKRDKPRLA